MKRTVYKANEIPAETSPITPKGQIVFSHLREFTDLNEPAVPYVELLTPDKLDALHVLRFIDGINGIGWTPELRRIERELRVALHDLMAVDVKAADKAQK